MSPRYSIELADVLNGCPVLTDRQMSEVRDRLRSAFPDSTALAGELRRRDWLTPYQLDLLMNGRGHDLILGSYRILEPLGQGGMGKVFKARHHILNRIVALKVIRPDWVNNPDAVRRFRKEVEAAARLNHPNVILAHDAQEIDGRFVLAMEYCAGLDLGRLVEEEGAIPVGRACEYIRQAALALEHVRELGMVHRDVKPKNLLLTNGTVKLLDLGLARLRPSGAGSGTSTLTEGGMIVGTPDYLAPEQAGDAHSVDIRADIYSLGCTLYFLLTGQVPFPGGALVEKLMRHRFDPPNPLGRVRPDLPAPIVQIVEKMMAKSPDERYATPGEAAAALTPWANSTGGEVVPARRISRRHVLIAVAVGATLLGVIFLARWLLR